MDNQNKKNNLWKKVLIAFVVIGISILSFATYKNPQLFRADTGSFGTISGSFKGGATETNDVDFYISSDYKAGLGESGDIKVYAGKSIIGLTSLEITIGLSSSGLSSSGVVFDDYAFAPSFFATINKQLSLDKKSIKVSINFSNPENFKANEHIFSVKLTNIST